MKEVRSARGVHRRRIADTFRVSMRQRSLPQRMFTALFGLWFSLLVAEPVPVHACPMHDGTLAQGAAVTAAGLTDAAPDSPGHVAMHHVSQSHEQPATDHPAEHGAHQCQCLGCCAGTTALSLPASPDVNLRAVLAPVQVECIAGGDVLRTATRFSFALPFANGPPVASLLPG